MLRSIFLSLVIGMLVTGCNFSLNLDIDNHENPAPEPVQTQSVDADTQAIDLAAVGEPCGSKIETLCEEGLQCEYTPGKTTGTCTRKDVDPKISCDKTKAPVCAQKGRERLSYLNECEANRHKAVILGEGFCSVQEVTDNCDSLVASVGNCGESFTGFEFSAETGACKAVEVRGCEIETPFESLIACESVCAQ